MEEGKFGVKNFYARRARRILPALFFVMAACVPLAWMWMAPSDMRNFAKSLVAVSTFSSNILFWRESGYFDTATELKPLLHTWSLAVEEQYYILFPLFLMMVWRLGKAKILLLVAVVAAVSLALAQWGSYAKPAAAFYLLPTRGWEILLGACAAFGLQKKGSPIGRAHLKQGLSLMGLLLIAFSIFAFGPQTPFPGVYALVPTVGALLIIVYATSETIVYRLLSNRVLVGMGLVSYSAYLWHQPLFAFARYRSLHPPSEFLMASLCVATIPIAVLSWRFVEMPFRRNSSWNQFPAAISAVGIAMAFSVFGVVGYFNGGFSARMNMPHTVARSFEINDRRSECFDKNQVHTRPDWLCRIGSSGENPSFVVFGDSHALSFLDVFDAAAKAENRAGFFTGASGCIPFLGIFALRNDQEERDCNALNSRIYDFVANNTTIKDVLFCRQMDILYRRWLSFEQFFLYFLV